MVGSFFDFVVRYLPKVLTYTAGFGLGLFGLPWEQSPMMPPGQESAPGSETLNSLWDTLTVFHDNYIALPIIFWLVFGFFLGDVCWPRIRELVTKHNAYKRFLSQRRDAALRRSVFRFFMHLGRAYHAWRGSNDADTMNEFLNNLEYPHWLKNNISSLSDEIRRHLKNPDRQWQFFFDLYKDFDLVIERGNEAKFLPSVDAYEEFHLARQDLVYFGRMWQNRYIINILYDTTVLER